MKLSKKLMICLLFITVFLMGCSNCEMNDVLEDNVANESERQAQDIDYSSYTRKIWINENSEKQASVDDLFIYLNELDDENVIGEIFVGKMPISSHFYYSSPFTGEYKWNLIGEVKEDSLECKIESDDMNGYISFMLNSSKIESKIKLMEEEALKDESSNEKVHSFRPYTIKDMSSNYEKMGLSIVTLEEYSFDIDIDSWGSVHFISMMVNSNKPHPIFLLTNENSEILYQFYAPFQNGLDVTEISIDDVDGDGLDDVVVILGDNDVSIGGVAPWIFLQTKDGVFCVNNEVQKKLNIEFYDTTHLETEKIKAFLEGN